MCLIAASVEPGRLNAGFRRMANAGIACGLIAVLLLVTACCASQALHQSLHRDSDAGSHFCLVCLFAKGQVSAAPMALISAAVLFYCLGSLRAEDAPAPAILDLRLSPSRAPPRS
jgi:hypothetical protein